MPKYRTKTVTEYPLYGFYKKCPTARFVGGTSIYLCECRDVLNCEGWQEAKAAGAQSHDLEVTIYPKKK